ncbi:MAG: hypothetical protein ACM336_14645 [Acidobacteriota bacterium]
MTRTQFAAALLAAPLGFEYRQDEPEPKLPSGKSQRDEILKVEHEKTMRDVDELQKLAAELKAEIEKSDYRVLPVASLKKTEQIEKLARKIRNRLRR